MCVSLCLRDCVYNKQTIKVFLNQIYTLYHARNSVSILLGAG